MNRDEAMIQEIGSEPVAIKGVTITSDIDQLEQMLEVQQYL